MLGTYVPCSFATPSPLASGVEQRWFDRSRRPQDDLFSAANGSWLDTASIPDDKSSIGALEDASDRTRRQLLDILQHASTSHAPKRTPLQRMGDLYASFMDEPRIESLGIAPLKGVFDRIDAIQSFDDVAAMLGYLESIDVDLIFSFWISPDVRDTTRHLANFISFATTLDDRHYIQDDAHSIRIRAGLLAYIERVLRLAGDSYAHENAARVAAFENALAWGHWPDDAHSPTAEIGDRANDVYSLSEITSMAPHFKWDVYLRAAGVAGRINAMRIHSRQQIAALDAVLARAPFDTIKAYLKYRYVNARINCLPKAFNDAHFAFFSKTVEGVESQPPRSLRGIDVVTSYLLDELGIEYAKRYFTPDKRARLRSMFTHLKKAYAIHIAQARWMAPQTRRHALLKLDRMTAQLGGANAASDIYDYSTLEIARDDLFANVERAERANYNYRIAQLDKPVSKTASQIDAYAVGAHYEPGTNQIVVGAGMLQPPYYHDGAEDAANYGGIGFVIAHEISHGFDANGARRDADGVIRDWWTEADHTHFDALKQHLTDQFNAFSPLPGYYVSGQETLSENMADSAGLDAAYLAYTLSLGGKPSPTIDGLSGKQRFYYAFAQVFRRKLRDTALIEHIETNPHAPPEYRVNGTVRNQLGFYEAFGVQAADKLYLPPGQRFRLWW